MNKCYLGPIREYCTRYNSVFLTVRESILEISRESIQPHNIAAMDRPWLVKLSDSTYRIEDLS